MRKHHALDATEILGDPAASHFPILVQILDNLGQHEYHFMSSDKYALLIRDDWCEAMRIYWLEILYRAHFAASTSLIRTARWVDAIITHAEEPNFTAFMASYRGCLEGAADSFHTFDSVPAQLAELHSIIRLAVAGKSKQPCLCKDLEDDLIHFTHARHVKRGEDVDDAHRAKQTRQYLESLASSGLSTVLNCYRTLCDVTHPGIGSVLCYAASFRTDSGSAYRLQFDQDRELISSFCDDNQQVSERMIFFGVVPPVITLRILNDFGVAEVYTAGVMKTGVDSHPAWRPYAARLRDPRPPGEPATNSPG